MSHQPPPGHRRAPLVYATPKAAQQGASLIARPVECAVRDALIAGHASGDPGEDVGVVRLDDGVIAVVRRSPSRLTGRKTWLIVGVRREAA